VRAGGLTPGDVLAFYDIKALRDRGFDGSGETIVLPEIDDLPNQSDLQKYAQLHDLPPFDVTVKRDSSWGQPEDAGKPGYEVTLDLEIAHAIAPGAKLVAYIGGPRQDQNLRLFDQLVRDNLGAVISDSIGACELETGSAVRQAAFDLNDRAVAQGMTHMVASGDLGAYGCGPDQGLGVDFPSALPNVTSVGGTTLFESTSGAYYRETAWGGPISQAGSGGGVSRFYERPDYQAGPGVQNRDSNGKRQVPDVAAVADVLSGWSIVVHGGKAQLGGTSAAAPLWAGVIAIINQALKKKGMRRVGFANPALYWMGQNQAKFQKPPFHDVKDGNNLYYGASQGWDYGTGWGSFDAAALEAAFESYIKQGGR
jgi:kumamolisin